MIPAQDERESKENLASIKSFLLELKTVAPDFAWEVNYRGIRGKAPNLRREFCPLQAVCFSRSRYLWKEIDNHNMWNVVDQTLGLRFVSLRIAQAGDSPRTYRERWLVIALLKAVGLSADAAN